MDVKLRAGRSAAPWTLRNQLLIEKLLKLESRAARSSKRCPTSPTTTWAGSIRRSRPSPTASRGCRTCTASSSPSTRCPAPKGITCLYGPPGCRQDAHRQLGAVANSLAKKVAETTGNANVRSYFLNIKGPGARTQQVRERDRSASGSDRSSSGPGRRPTRACRSSRLLRRDGVISSAPGAPGSAPTWSRRSLPQLLAEIDGVESLRDVIVIGASNREDLIDHGHPAPGYQAWM